MRSKGDDISSVAIELILYHFKTCLEYGSQTLNRIKWCVVGEIASVTMITLVRLLQQIQQENQKQKTLDRKCEDLLSLDSRKTRQALYINVFKCTF